MKTEDKYHKDWLLKKDSALSEEVSTSLDVYLKEHPQQLVEWKILDAQIDVLNTVDFTFSDGFEFKVMDQWNIEKEQLFNQSSKVILYAGIAAAVLLMINLCVTQNSLSLDALFGIVDMNADNTSFLFYID
jgi:hypothetical protein